jgi:hypothetical protein
MGRDDACRIFNGEHWLPLADDYVHENVVNLEADAVSILNL